MNYFDIYNNKNNIVNHYKLAHNLMKSKVIEYTDWTNYISGKSNNGGNYVTGTTYTHTRNGWRCVDNTSCDMIPYSDPYYDEYYKSDSDMFWMLVRILGQDPGERIDCREEQPTIEISNDKLTVGIFHKEEN